MAKVKGPLFSLGARGQIAKTLVYMSWKGIDDVREYVIPANPKTDDQKEQRNFFKNAITEWHEAGFTAVDVKAWDLYASALKKAASGFNIFVSLKVKAAVAAFSWTSMTDCLITNIVTTSCDVTILPADADVKTLCIGTTKTAMVREIAGSCPNGAFEFTVDGLVADTTYYFYVKSDWGNDVARTGIYTFKTAAA